MARPIRNMARVAHELTAGRAANNAVYGVYCLKKDGARYAKPSATERTEAGADRVCARMTDLNPGFTFVVLAV